MKNRILVMLLLPTVLGLLAFGQQTNSDASAQPPLQNEGTTCKEPPQPAASKDFWDGDEPNAANLVGHEVNRKKDVQKQIQPIQNCLNEMRDAAASHTKMSKEVDPHTQQGIQLGSARAKDADEHAIDAGNRANAAHQTAAQPITRLSTAEHVVANIDQYKADTQTEVHFRPGQSVLSREAEHALDEMAAPLKHQRGYVIEVQGFSSGRGQAAIAASRKMADSVVRYLVLNHEIPAHRIYVVGMGNAPVTGSGGTAAKRASDNRIEISVLKNDVDQLASTPASVPNSSPK